MANLGVLRGIGLSATVDGRNQQLVNSGGIITGGYSPYNAVPVLGFECSPTIVYNNGQNYTSLSITENVTWNQTNWPGGAAHAVTISPLWNINATGTFTKVVLGMININPTVVSSSNLTNVNPIFISPGWDYTSGVTATNYAGTIIQGNTLGNVSGEATALSVGTVGGNLGSTISATCVALDVGWSTLGQGIDSTNITGPIWGMGIATYPSFMGALVLGNINQGGSAPTGVNYLIDMQATAFNQVSPWNGGARGTVQPVIGSIAATSAPTTPASNAGWCGFWFGGTHYYYVIALNSTSAGGMVYKYMQMDSTGSATWSYNTVLPA